MRPGQWLLSTIAVEQRRQPGDCLARVQAQIERAVEARDDGRHRDDEAARAGAVERLAAMAHAVGALFHTDAVQAPGYLPLDVRALGVDFVGINLHKWIGAPLGVGVVYIRKDRIKDIEPARR